MPGSVLTVVDTMMCQHGSPVTHVPGQVRVKIAGAFAMVAPDQGMVAGCPFMIGNKPSPCVTVQWTAPAVRVKFGGQPALIATSAGLGKSPEQAPQGKVTIPAPQPRVKAT